MPHDFSIPCVDPHLASIQGVTPHAENLKVMNGMVFPVTVFVMNVEHLLLLVIATL